MTKGTSGSHDTDYKNERENKVGTQYREEPTVHHTPTLVMESCETDITKAQNSQHGYGSDENSSSSMAPD